MQKDDVYRVLDDALMSLDLNCLNYAKSRLKYAINLIDIIAEENSPLARTPEGKGTRDDTHMGTTVNYVAKANN